MAMDGGMNTMDWKREAMDKLKCYAAKSTSFDRAREELERLEIEKTKIRSATSDATPVSGGTNRREDAMISNIVRREELKLAMKEARNWCRFVDSGLAELDAQERRILDLFYIHPAKGNVDRLCEELCLEKTRVYELKDKALRHFTLALYGVVET